MPTFTVRPGIYLSPTGDPATATQRWHRDGVAIPGSTGTSYTTASPADDGKLIEYVENVANSVGSAAEQRLTLQAAALPTSIVTGASQWLPRGPVDRPVSKYTVVQRLFANGLFTNFLTLFANSGTSAILNTDDTIRIYLYVPDYTEFATSLATGPINANFVSLMFSVDYLNSGDLGSNVIAKLRMKGTGIDATHAVSAPGGYSAGSRTANRDWINNIGTTTQLQGWSYYNEGVALDPAVYWDDFFDAGAMPKSILGNWPASSTPSFYLPAIASEWGNDNNLGADPSFISIQTGVTDV